MSILNSIVSVISGGSGGGSIPPVGGNTILAIWTEDIARDWVRIEFQNSIGVTPPLISQFTITGKTVEEVVMRADKVLYLRVDSHFASGASITMSYIASGMALGELGNQSGVPITNNISSRPFEVWSTERINHFNNQDTDLNAAEGWGTDGAVIELDNINFGAVDIGRAENLIFVAKYGGDTEATYFNAREAVLHFTLVGHPASLTKNMKIHNGQAYFGIELSATGNLRVEYVDIYDVVQGIQVKTVSDLLFPPYNLSREDYQNLIFKNSRVANTTQEAAYIGAHIPAPLIPITWDIQDIELEDIGMDGIQVRNGSGEVKRVTATKNLQDYAIGWAENAIHAHFLAYGEVTTGGLFEDCVCEDGAFGNLIFCNGYGEVTFRRISGRSELNAVYINNYGTQDSFSVGSKTVNFEGANSFDVIRTTGDPKSLDARRDAAVGKTDITLNINPETTFTDGTYIEDWPEEEVPSAPGTYWGGIVVNYT